MSKFVRKEHKQHKDTTDKAVTLIEFSVCLLSNVHDRTFEMIWQVFELCKLRNYVKLRGYFVFRRKQEEISKGVIR